MTPDSARREAPLGKRRPMTVDAQLGIALPVALRFAIMLAAPEFDDADFRPAPLGFDGSGHPATFDIRCADFDSVAVGDHQHRIEFHGGAFLDFELFDLEGLPSATRYCLPPVLMTAYIDQFSKTTLAVPTKGAILAVCSAQVKQIPVVRKA
jgi:hypothetical protein